MTFGGDDITQRQEAETTVPDFLQPFVQQQGEVAGGALDELSNLIGGNDLFADFDPLQTEGQEGIAGVARGFDPGAFIDPAQQGLEETAAGDFLFGGPGFDEAVNASVRATRPSILSTFGRAGGGTGGLAQAAIARQASDAFARQFGNERSRQFAAQTALPGFGQAALGLQSLPFELLQQIGGLRQGQAQSEINAPITAQQGLLGAAGGGIPLASLLGRSGSQTQEVQSDPLGQALGLGIAGLGLASGIAPPSAAAQAAGGFGGGLLGGLFS